MKVYIVEVETRKGWKPTGPNWFEFKYEAENAKKAFESSEGPPIPERDRAKYRVGVYRAIA